MKIILLVLVLAVLPTAYAQQPPPPAAVPALPAKAPRAVPSPELEKTVTEVIRRGFGAAEEAVNGAAVLAGRAVSLADAVEQQNAAVRALSAAVPTTAARGSRTLVVQSSEPDSVGVANTEEDLAIMARILDKTARTGPDDGRHYALGINVDGAVFGSASGARNIYLEGYGALFLLGVRYPLIAPPEKPEEPKVKDTSSDEWKKAREELQGALRGGGEVQYDNWVSTTPRGPVEEFDADRVEKLKDSLLDALKNATHIRSLKPTDFVTVVVQGADVARADVKRVRTAGNDKTDTNRYVRTVRKSGGEQSVLTLRVKKADADAFAEGKMGLEEFRKKASIQTYLRKSDSSSAANYFMQTVR